jgi:hypothetical protein
MGRREQAREEASFLRGDVGVDGQATEEKVDAIEAERGKAREQFLRGKAYLGREFLTWLLWRSESSEPLLELDGQPLTVLLTKRLVLRGIAGDVVETIMTGAMAPYSPLVRQSLNRGLLIHATRLRLVHGEETYEINVDAEYLDLKSGKLPTLLGEKGEEDVHERLRFAERLSGLVHALLEAFLRQRASRKWPQEIVPAMKEWMAAVPVEAKGEKKRKTG